MLAIPDGQNFHQKVQALAIIKSKYLYTRRKVSVSSVEQSSLVVANSVVQVLEPVALGRLVIFCKEQPLGHCLM